MTAEQAGQSIVLVDATSTSVTISWPEVEGADLYVLQYRKGGDDDTQWQTLSEALKTTQIRKKNLSEENPRDPQGFFFRVAAQIGTARLPWITHDVPFYVMVRYRDMLGIETDMEMRMGAPVVRPCKRQGTDRAAIVRWKNLSREHHALVSASLAAANSSSPSPNSSRYELQIRENVGGSPWRTLSDTLAGTEVRKKNLNSPRGYHFRISPAGLSSIGKDPRSKVFEPLSFSPPSEVIVIAEDETTSCLRLLNTNKDPLACALCSSTIAGGSLCMPCCGSEVCTGCGESRRLFYYDINTSKHCAVCRGETPNDFDDCVRMALAAAERGQAWAQFDVGKCYQGGCGVDLSHARAVYWFGKAAEQGHPSAYNSLGVKYAKGEGCIADPFMAERYFRRAADLPDTLSTRGKDRGIQNLAKLFADKGRDEEARDLWLRLANKGNAQAQCCLGKLCSVKLQKVEEGAEWCRSAALQGHRGAAEDLVHTYMTLERYALAKFWLNIVMKFELSVASERELQGCAEKLQVYERSCGACNSTLGTPQQNMCKQCLTFCYCRRLCQIRHWNRGHKIDCKEVHELKERKGLAELFEGEPKDWFASGC